MSRRGFNDALLPEIEAGKYLDHPKITNIVDSYISTSLNESTVMVMELLPGKTLGSEIDSHKGKENTTMIPKALMFNWL
jgi:serine/threonine protein kinase